MIKEKLVRYLEESQRSRDSISELIPMIEEVAHVCVEKIKSGGRIYTFGNGGSACDSMHFVQELVARFDRDRAGIPAHHLLDGGTMTCWLNDISGETIFSRQVETLVTDKDIVFGFSTSGNSKNILRGLEKAKEKNATVVGMLGKNGGEAKNLVDFPLIVSGNKAHFIQEGHIVLVHIFCELFETMLFNLE